MQLLLFIKNVKEIRLFWVDFDRNKLKVFILVNVLHFTLAKFFLIKANPKQPVNLILFIKCALKEIALMITVSYSESFHHLEVGRRRQKQLGHVRCRQ